MISGRNTGSQIQVRYVAWQLALTIAASTGAAHAQPGPARSAPGQSQAPANPADQLVGLFGATCLHFAANPSGLRSFLIQQAAPAMPQQARDAFLAGRVGQVYDVSVPGVNLALVSLDDGGCEAVAEKADRAQVLSNLRQAAQEAGQTMTPIGAQSDSGPNGVQHAAFQLTEGGHEMHVLVSTAPASPQAVITLAPK